MLEIRPISERDRVWIETLLRKHWGSTIQVTRGRLHDASKLPGYVAVYHHERAGLITYRVERDVCEIITLNSLVEGRGIGTALVQAVRRAAVEAGCKRLWLITTNDNLTALCFWQKRGFSLLQVHRNAVEESRRLKPEIPLTGEHGIPIRDEIELEITL
jgi:N-acetylglutamate synthase-like GNAT family acetyltransferase